MHNVTDRCHQIVVLAVAGMMQKCRAYLHFVTKHRVISAIGYVTKIIDVLIASENISYLRPLVCMSSDPLMKPKMLSYHYIWLSRGYLSLSISYLIVAYNSASRSPPTFGSWMRPYVFEFKIIYWKLYTNVTTED